MRLSAWRKSKSMSCADVARALGLDNDRDGTSIWNWEAGRARPDADMIERIEDLTAGAVTAADMHAVRLSWLKTNRPEKFVDILPCAAGEVSPEATEGAEDLADLSDAPLVPSGHSPRKRGETSSATAGDANAEAAE